MSVLEEDLKYKWPKSFFLERKGWSICKVDLFFKKEACKI